MTSRRRLKCALLATMTVGALGWVTIPGVWAVFSAETRNTQASASTGTLTMDMSVGASSCSSKAGPASPGNVNASCTAYFTYAPATENYPGTPRTVQVTIKNTGSRDASDLSLYATTACTAATTADAPASVVGTGDPCSVDQITVQETNASFASNVKCYWPTTGTTCAASSLTLNNFVANFSTTASSALDLGTGPAAQQSRYFLIGLSVPSAATNAVQGREALFTLAWHLTS